MTQHNYEEIDKMFIGFMSRHSNIMGGLDSNMIKNLKSFVKSVHSSAVEETKKADIEIIQKYYEKKKIEPLPTMRPKASPSLSHYKERTQGFLSGLLVAKDLLSNLQK